MGSQGFIASIIIGAIAGYLAYKIARGESRGCLTNLIVGVVGGVVGNWVIGFFGLYSKGGMFSSIAVSTLGAVVLLYVVNALGGKKQEK